MIELLNMDCMEYMKSQAENSFDAIIADPPYLGVKECDWDNKWDSEDEFLAWIGELCSEFYRVLKPNGSIYLFASPRMASKVELEIGKHFNVLNHIVWRKGDFGLQSQTRGRGSNKQVLRSFWDESERIIFAEHWDSDKIAAGGAGYRSKCDELKGSVFEPIRSYLDGERQRSGVSKSQITEWFGSKGFPKFVVTRHCFSASQWEMPTEENYNRLRDCLNDLGQHEGSLDKSYAFLVSEYQYLRKEYDELRKEYEQLRRPFNLTPKMQWGDIWAFDPVPTYPDKHPCEKPQALLHHILSCSVRPGTCVLDPFMGGGSLAIASHRYGCSYVGCELDPSHYENAVAHYERAEAQSDLFDGGAA